MKISKSTSKTKTVLLVALVIVLAAAAGAYAFRDQLGLTSIGSSDKNTNIDYGKTSDDQAEGEKTAEQTDNNHGTVDSPASGTDKDQKNNVGVEITSANQNGSMLQIRAIVQKVTNTGTCSLTLSKSGEQPIKKTAAIQTATTYSTCQGFNVPTSNMATGVWNISLNFENDSTTGSATSTTTIN
jgi:hypothetical protein